MSDRKRDPGQQDRRGIHAISHDPTTDRSPAESGHQPAYRSRFNSSPTLWWKPRRPRSFSGDPIWIRKGVAFSWRSSLPHRRSTAFAAW